MTEVDPHVLDQVRCRLAEAGSGVTPAGVAEALRASAGLVGDALVLDVLDALRRDSLGAGPLEPLLALEDVTDVLVNGPDEVYVDAGAGLELTSVRFASDDDVRRLAQRLASAAGRRLDDAQPYVDVRLRGGTRFHALLAPLARPGTCLSLRVPARRVWTLDELVGADTIHRAAVGPLRDLMSARLPFVITGGTGSGKTTLLNALLSLVSPRERVVVVEDAGELRPRHPHVISLEARPPNIEGAGEVSLRTLVRQALRMRPDRLVVGEVRGAEVVDLLAAMNTGHEGGCSTVHANSATDLPARFEALGVTAGMTRDAVSAQLAAAVDVVLHLRRDGDGRRRMTEIGIVDRSGSGPVRVLTAVSFQPGQRPDMGPGAAALEDRLQRADSR